VTRVEQKLKDGNLDQALADLLQHVCNKPEDVKARIFLFQLLAVQGAWDRALNQLKVIGALDVGSVPMVYTYQQTIRCELLRTDVFAGRTAPPVLGQPERWLALLLEALRLTGEGYHAQAASLREEALELASATTGRIDSDAFEWIADADPRLGPVCEAVVNDGYYWVPFQRIRELRIDPPSDLRDAVWMPVEFLWTSGGRAAGFIPTRYPGTETSSMPALQLSRRTEWYEPEPGVYLGLGQRMLVTDQREYAVMDVRHIVIEPQTTTTSKSSGEAKPTVMASPNG
jgi:type VI secretion system protein ImpE